MSTSEGHAVTVQMTSREHWTESVCNNADRSAVRKDRAENGLSVASLRRCTRDVVHATWTTHVDADLDGGVCVIAADRHSSH